VKEKCSLFIVHSNVKKEEGPKSEVGNTERSPPWGGKITPFSGMGRCKGEKESIITKVGKERRAVPTPESSARRGKTAEGEDCVGGVWVLLITKPGPSEWGNSDREKNRDYLSSKRGHARGGKIHGGVRGALDLQPRIRRQAFFRNEPWECNTIKLGVAEKSARVGAGTKGKGAIFLPNWEAMDMGGRETSL